MTEPPGENSDLVDELGEIVGQLRAYLKWQQVSGASGLPRDPRSKEELRRALSVTGSVESPGFEQPGRGAPSRSESTIPTAAHPASSVPTAAHLASSVPTAAHLAAAHEVQSEATVSPPLPVEKAAPSLPIVTPPAWGDTLDDLQKIVADCTKCSLHLGRTQTVFSRGTGSSGLCFVGEGPGADEDAQGFPFVGAAGQLLDKMIEAMGLERDEVYICNIVKCRPPENRKPAPEEMSACSAFLERQLALINPQVIVALGATAALGLLGDTRGITKIRGKFRLYQGKIAVMPTFHPAYLLRNPGAKREVWTDLQQVLKHMGRPLKGK